MQKRLLLGLIVVIALTGAYVLIHTFGNPSSPASNKQLELRAYTSHDPSICDKIKGESYGFGPTDGRITVSETDAVAQCKQNISRHTPPVMHGG